MWMGAGHSLAADTTEARIIRQKVAEKRLSYSNNSMAVGTTCLVYKRMLASHLAVRCLDDSPFSKGLITPIFVWN